MPRREPKQRHIRYLAAFPSVMREMPQPARRCRPHLCHLPQLPHDGSEDYFPKGSKVIGVAGGLAEGAAAHLAVFIANTSCIIPPGLGNKIARGTSASRNRSGFFRLRVGGITF